MKFSKKLRKDAAIDIASLVDVVFLLLLFFVVTTTFRENPGLKMDLPETREEAGVRLKEAVVRIVPEDGDSAVYLLSERVTLEELPGKLKTLLESMEEDDRSVVVEADKNVRFEVVFAVLDIARTSGATNITFPAIFNPEAAEQER